MHIGHAKLFQACRQYGTTLIVGVHSDAVVAGYKRAPVFCEDGEPSVRGMCCVVCPPFRRRQEARTTLDIQGPLYS
jgi:glycerol-3-phosphate cytidylyltransferase-like family protein